MKNLPENLVHYKSTATFDENSVPAGLLKDHQTQAGIWGKIVIESGRLEYTIYSDPQEVLELSHNRFGVVEPEIKHHVKPLGQVRFHVEFFK